MKIGLDVMGGDFAPDAAISGALLAAEALSGEDQIVLIGNRQIILDGLSARGIAEDNFDIVHAPDII
ncbi:MAG TPA: phosphate--acyl-ACP acyltransferase, partial [Bacteroidales bacterium]|nr:phosphate--acyl-ACP acyltransferase [Bacteroidales bacterium]